MTLTVPRENMNSPRPRVNCSRGFLPQKKAFTLIELLVVVTIGAAMLALVSLALRGNKGAVEFSKACYDIAGALQVARTYATANNTYVWVGFFEENIATGNGTSGVGRIVISTVASRDGTSIYNRETAMAASSTQALSGTSLIQVGKILKVDNMHLMADPPAFGNRPGSQLTGTMLAYRIGAETGATPLFSFSYPLTSTARYTFSGGAGRGIVQFSPQGEAITQNGPVPGVSSCIEIALQSTHGTTLDTGGNIAAIDIAGITGAITIYRK